MEYGTMAQCKMVTSALVQCTKAQTATSTNSCWHYLTNQCSKTAMAIEAYNLLIDKQ
jgi:hypothetical protein